MLNGLQIIPYDLELRNTLDAALSHLKDLEREAGVAISAQDEMRAVGGGNRPQWQACYSSK
jgi:hypothetical protein